MIILSQGRQLHTSAVDGCHIYIKNVINTLVKTHNFITVRAEEYIETRHILNTTAEPL